MKKLLQAVSFLANLLCIFSQTLELKANRNSVQTIFLNRSLSTTTSITTTAAAFCVKGGYSKHMIKYSKMMALDAKIDSWGLPLVTGFVKPL